MIDKTKFSEKQNQFINNLAEEFKTTVEKIEKSIPETRNHYGKYMGIISFFSAGNKFKAQVISLALIKAGANELGIMDALHVMQID